MGYPIKYAIEELKINGGIQYDYEDITIGYIVSKCYVIEGRIDFGNNSMSYVVSFPYDNYEYFNSWFNNNKHNYNKYIQDIYKHYFEPRLDPSGERFRGEYPRHIVSNLFDTYEEAKEIADRKNGCLRGEILRNTGSNAYEKLKKEFEDTMDVCGEYEKFVFANTIDMNVLIGNEIVNNIKEIEKNTLVKKLIL